MCGLRSRTRNNATDPPPQMSASAGVSRADRLTADGRERQLLHVPKSFCHRSLGNEQRPSAAETTAPPSDLAWRRHPDTRPIFDQPTQRGSCGFRKARPLESTKRASPRTGVRCQVDLFFAATARPNAENAARIITGPPV